MTLFGDFDFYLNQYTFEVQDKTKTIYEDYIALDSQTENIFARHCESSEQVEFYFKLPKRFKIPTPLGSYNPDWAVVFKEKIKFTWLPKRKIQAKVFKQE